MADRRLLELPAVAMRDRLATGALRSAELAEAAIERVQANESGTRAFAWFDADFVRRQAQGLDAHRGSGRPLGALHGIPVAVEDTIDTAGLPTEYGAVCERGRIPEKDAGIVERLRAAGALILGKTAISELGFTGGTTPYSCGAAAAVAARMAPLSVGSHGEGSTIGAASEQGVTGFRPSFGSISRRGVLRLAPSMDAPGVFAADVTDAALLSDALFGHDVDDTATSLVPAPKLLDQALSRPPVAPTFAFIRTMWWDRLDAETQGAFGELTEVLGERCFEADLPPVFADSDVFFERIMLAEMAKCLFGYKQRHSELLSDRLKESLTRGEAVTARDYLAALDWRGVLYAGLQAILERCDVILTPATGKSDAPVNRLWSLLGVPCVTLPLLEAPGGKPIGVQLVGARGWDGRVLRTAHWLETFISKQGG